MNKLKNYLLCLLGGASFIMVTYAQDNDPNAFALMTARDMKSNASSNITIINRTNQSIPASGLFIASYDVNDCSACFGNLVAGDNLGGSVISPVTFNVNQAVPIGQNFLYNMIYNGIYFIKNTAGTSPCSLPGCSWPGDDPNVTGWCLTINVISRHSSYTFSNYTNGANPPANSPAYSDPGESNPFSYNYDLIDPRTLGAGNACLGPITCDDKTLTCKVGSAQSESLQAYTH